MTDPKRHDRFSDQTTENVIRKFADRSLKTATPAASYWLRRVVS